METNSLGQPLDEAIPGWTSALAPDGTSLTGRYCRLERLRPNHAAGLFEADQLDTLGRSWTYLPYRPFTELSVYEDWVQHMSATSDPIFYAVIDRDAEAGLHAEPAARPNPAGQAATERPTTQPLEREVGVLSFLRIAPESGSIEVGHVHQKAPLARLS